MYHSYNTVSQLIQQYSLVKYRCHPILNHIAKLLLFAQACNWNQGRRSIFIFDQWYLYWLYYLFTGILAFKNVNHYKY